MPASTRDWDSAQLQDRRWRRAVEQLSNPAVPTAQRVKAARKILRDGSDLACCMLFSACRAADPAGTWGEQHPFSSVRGAVRFRALRILGRPSKLQGRDHHVAAQLLPWIAKPRDQVILTRQLETRLSEHERPALTALARIIDDIDDIDEALLATISERVRDPDQPSTTHAALAQVLAAWPDERALTLLRDGAAHPDHVQRWPYIAALLARSPEEGRALATDHRDRLGPHHIHAADVRDALGASQQRPG